MWGHDKLEKNMNVPSQSQCLKKYIFTWAEKQSTFTSYKILTIGYSIHKKKSANLIL